MKCGSNETWETVATLSQEADCGCRVQKHRHVCPADPVFQIAFCPLHAAADEMLAALKRANEAIHDYAESNAECHEAIEQAERAIAKAEV